MIKVYVGTTVKREPKIVAKETTLREVLESAGIDYAGGGVTLDSAYLQPGDMDKTFADFGVTTTCYLLRVVKADNA